MAIEEPITDVGLVTRAQAGDAGAFEALVARYRGRVYGLCLHRVGDPDEANDLAQESFVRVYQEIGSVRCPEAFPGWLRRVANNVCSAWIRRNRPLVLDSETLAAVAGESTGSVEEAVERRLAAHRVREALSVLSEPVRLTVTLFYMDGYSYKEIAAFLEAPVETVRGRLRDARRRLRKELWDMAEETTRAAQPGPEFERAVAKRVEVAEWYRSFAEMIAAGISLMRCLATLEQDPFSPPIRAATRRVMQAIEGGGTLSRALLEEPVLADKMVVGMVRAGEIGGILDKTLAMLDQWQRIDEAARRMELALWCRTLHTLLISGVPILQAMETVAGLGASEGLRDATLRIRADFREGRSIGEVLFAAPDLFPTVIALLLVAGECSGELEQTLLDASALLAEDLAQAVGPPVETPAPRRYLEVVGSMIEARSPEERARVAVAVRPQWGDRALPTFTAAFRQVGSLGPAVARLFSTQPPERALPVLLQACRDADPETRLAGARALAEMRLDAAWDPLTALARDPDTRIRRVAVRALAESGDPANADTLARSLQDRDQRVLMAAVEGLERIGVPAAETVLGVTYSQGAGHRAFAAGVLRRMDTPDVRKRLRVLLADPENRVRLAAATSLNDFRDAGAMDTLIELTGDPDEYVRRLAADALGSTRDDRAVETLIGLTEDPEPSVRQWAAEALGRQGDPRGVPALVRLVAAGRHPAGWAATALEKIGHPSAIPLLRALLDDPSKEGWAHRYAERVIKVLDAGSSG